MHTTAPRRHRGITLVENLVALVVTAFGALALVNFQAQLEHQADVSRQRTEATRLAQDKLEQLRAFEQVASAAGKVAYADWVDGSDAPGLASNTEYLRSWTLGGSAEDPLRVVRVTVDWTDRSGETGRDSVVLHSVIARADPADGGSLAVPTPGNDPLLRAFGRHRQIPLRAVSLRGANRGRSSLPWPGPSGGFLVFDDASGFVVSLCAVQPGDATPLSQACLPMRALLLQGHLGGDLPPGLPRPVFDRLQHLQPGTAPQCVLEAVTDALGGMPDQTLLRYRCLIQPADHDADPATPAVWSGRLRWAGLPAGTQTCRYASPAQTADNAPRHPETYTLVGASLDHQNYLLVAAGECPAGTIAHPPA